MVSILYLRKKEKNMEYKKPVILNPDLVMAAVCGSGPCGRPCDKKA